jgi:glycosyltransferase involved in cell wall biosynthesis
MVYQPASQVTVSSFPSVRDDNPYLSLCHKALEEHGVRLDRSNGDYLDWRWLLHNRRRVNLLHLHWMHYHYVRSNRAASVVAFMKLVVKLLLARMLGYRIVWTMHNVLPHERSSPSILDYLGRIFMAQLATSVIVHCNYGQDVLAHRFHRKRRVFVVPLPNYGTVLPSGGSREEARAKLGLQQVELVFLFFGAIRQYKGVTDLIAAFREIPRVDQALVVAGKPANGDIAADIILRVAKDARILTELEYVSDRKLEMYLRAASAVVLPFRDVLTSSSAMLALSASRPVVAPAIGCLPELLTPECGILYDPADPDGLREALARCRHLALDAMGRQASRRAQQFTAERVALETLKAYRA